MHIIKHFVGLNEYFLPSYGGSLICGVFRPREHIYNLADRILINGMVQKLLSLATQ